MNSSTYAVFHAENGFGVQIGPKPTQDPILTNFRKNWFFMPNETWAWNPHKFEISGRPLGDPKLLSKNTVLHWTDFDSFKMGFETIFFLDYFFCLVSLRWGTQTPPTPHQSHTKYPPNTHQHLSYQNRPKLDANMPSLVDLIFWSIFARNFDPPNPNNSFKSDTSWRIFSISEFKFDSFRIFSECSTAPDSCIFVNSFWRFFAAQIEAPNPPHNPNPRPIVMMSIISQATLCTFMVCGRNRADSFDFKT